MDDDGNYSPLREDKRYEMVWANDGSNVLGKQVRPGDEFMFTFQSSDRKIRVRKFLNNIATNIAPKVKVFNYDDVNSGIRGHVGTPGSYYYKDIMPSDVSSNAIKSWMWFFVGGSGGKINMGFCTTRVGGLLNNQYRDEYAKNAADNIKANPYLRIETATNGLSTTNDNALATRAALSAYFAAGQPFVVSSLNSSDAWTNHGYVRGGDAVMEMKEYATIESSDTTVGLDLSTLRLFNPIQFPLESPNPFTSSALAEINTISGQDAVRGTVLKDMPIMVQRRGFNFADLGSGVSDSETFGLLESLLTGGSPGETLVATPPVEKIRLWAPSADGLSEYFQRGIYSSGTFIRSGFSSSVPSNIGFLQGGSFNVSDYMVFTRNRGYMVDYLPELTAAVPSGRRGPTFIGNQEVPQSGSNGYIIVFYWED